MLTIPEKLVLRLVARDEDYLRLESLVGELREYFPQSTQQKLIDTTRATLKSLIDKGLIATYSERFKEDSDNAARTPLTNAESEKALNKDEAWAPNYGAQERISIATTSSGQKEYESLAPL